MAYLLNQLRTFSRHWYIKVFVQNLIGILPGEFAFRLNEVITRFARGSMDKRVSPKKRVLRSIKNIELIYQCNKEFSLSNKRVLEIGTGWHGIDLIMFYLLGAKSIITIDQHPHLSLENLSVVIDSFEDPECIERLNKLNFSQEKLRRLKKKIVDVSSLDELLTIMGIKYLIMPSSRYNTLSLEQNSIDLFYSESVLQRIPEKHLQNLFHIVGNRFLCNGATIFHRTDQNDINAQRHADGNLWALNYLRYSDWFFNLFLSGKFNSQNRFRESDFLKLFEASDMSIIHLESLCVKKDFERLKNFKVAHRFSKKSIEDLAVRHSKIVGLKQPNEVSKPLSRKVYKL